jgi:ribosomal protein S18 acetylase RimI-like enzyme
MTDQLDPSLDLSVLDFSVLDNPVWSSLTGPHARLARIAGAAGRYPADMAVFCGLSDGDDPAAWVDLARITDPGDEVVTVGVGTSPPGWDVLVDISGVQFEGTALRGAPDDEAIQLGPADVPEMLDLVRRTKPGPFEQRTIELGTYLGVRRGGALVAMAGERLHPTGWTEISAVCTDPAHRGQGLAARLVSAVTAGIRERGESPFLHTEATNAGAIRVYEALGFTLRRSISFRVLRRTISG